MVLPTLLEFACRCHRRLWLSELPCSCSRSFIKMGRERRMGQHDSWKTEGAFCGVQPASGDGGERLRHRGSAQALEDSPRESQGWNCQRAWGPVQAGPSPIQHYPVGAHAEPWKPSIGNPVINPHLLQERLPLDSCPSPGGPALGSAVHPAEKCSCLTYTQQACPLRCPSLPSVARDITGWGTGKSPRPQARLAAFD